ncbi:MAG: hypothetical protein OXP75_07585 [Rhodospirillales bacterium]|nr:hypothetical protein [Rhodospirillales bacterium]
MSKYAPLADHLRGSGQESVPMTFADIEKVIGAKLPQSAFTHRAWWSNNPTNNVMTQSWLEAGYTTAEVDMAAHKLVFRKAAQYGPAAKSGSGELRDVAPAPSTAEVASFSVVFGALKGTVTIKPGTDLTAPVKADWEAGR